MSIFKRGSIRGRWNKEWDEETVYRIGYYLIEVLHLKNIVIGQDGRNSSTEICDALTRGLVRGGCSVFLLGEIDTPAISFANIQGNYDGSIMITASHNPPEYNGLKISGRGALVISKCNGLDFLESLIVNEVGPEIPGGLIESVDLTDEYLELFTEYQSECGAVKCVVDCSNGMASVLIHRIVSELPGDYIIINDAVNGSFPAHGPDPTNESNLKELKNRVLAEKADLGICFDGDGDRTIFIDEKGRWISPSHILALIGLYYFKYFPDKKGGDDGVLYDARSSNSVKEYIEELGGKAYMCKTGHTAMQFGIPEHDGIFGGELPGHYYYRDFHSLDNGWIPFFQIQTVLSLEKKPLSTIIDRINRYYFSGERNFKLPENIIENNKFIETFLERYKAGKVTSLDGIRIDYEDWWFLVRTANTEPILRLVVEGRTMGLMKEKVEELASIIYSLGGSEHL
ncbi:MAG: phosphomannomutase/phosphoglucomutase [Spirochaetales bacterium]|nr:phosphomannomutase/phosphoglucomutase [Spirochaetales bacterium]